VRLKNGKKKRSFDPFLDLDAYSRLVSVQERTGIFTIGGGVPRNWAQQAGPFLDLVEKRMGLPGRGFRFRYGLRVCPEPVHWGGLSGCTYREGVSWGKFVPEEEGGRFSEILADATIVWPLLVRGMIERLGDTPLEKKLVPRPPPEESLFTLRTPKK
jgi:deoxyhypusine synthase